MADNETPDMSEMQRLLDEQEAQFKTIKRGDVVEGQIVHMDADEILVDIGLKSEGVLSTKELPSSGYGSRDELHVGDNVLVYVMQPETPEGHAIVSIKRARQERQWRIAQEQYERGELLEAEVIDYNKGGLIVNLEGIRGFVPISQILNLKREDNAESTETQQKLASMKDKRLQLKIIEINRNRNRLILSERLAVQEWRARRREELLNELTVGEVRTGTVSNLANFGAFVDLGGADGLVHISQLAWSRVNHPSEVLKVGQKVEVQVLSVDKEKKKIALSIKRAEVDPWTTVEQRYFPGQLVTGTITKIAPFGAFARIEDGIEGLIHLSELPAGTTEPKAALHEGQEVTVRILRIDAERRRLGLSVRQADEIPTTAAQEPAETEPAARVSGEESVEGRAEVGAPAAASEAATGAAPAPARPRPQPREEPATAMAEAFRLANLAQQQQVPQTSLASPSGREQTAAPAAEAPASEAPAQIAAESPVEAAVATSAAPSVEAAVEPSADAVEAPAAVAAAELETQPSGKARGRATSEAADQAEAPVETAVAAASDAERTAQPAAAVKVQAESQTESQAESKAEPTDSQADGTPQATTQTVEPKKSRKRDEPEEHEDEVSQSPAATTQEA
jgi:small subunit ribosomal protein S1